MKASNKASEGAPVPSSGAAAQGEPQPSQVVDREHGGHGPDLPAVEDGSAIMRPFWVGWVL